MTHLNSESEENEWQVNFRRRLRTRRSSSCQDKDDANFRNERSAT